MQSPNDAPGRSSRPFPEFTPSGAQPTPPDAKQVVSAPQPAPITETESEPEPSGITKGSAPNSHYLTAFLTLLAAAATLLALRMLLGDALWNETEGINGATSRSLLHGGDLYGDVAATQPPLFYVVGSVLLAISESAKGLRLGVAELQVITALLGSLIVWRLSGSRVATVFCAPLMLLSPLSVHESMAFTPEVVGVPFALGAAVLASRGSNSLLAGVLAAASVLISYPLVLVAIGLFAVTAHRKQYAKGALITLGIFVVAFTVLFGPAVWRESIVAPVQAGIRTFGGMGSLAAQVGWLSGAIVLTGISAWVVRSRFKDQALVATMAALVLGSLFSLSFAALQATTMYLATTLEAAIIPLSVAAFALVLQRLLARAEHAHGDFQQVQRIKSQALVVGALAGILISLPLSQSASLIRSPGEPKWFTRPGAPVGFRTVMSKDQVRSEIRIATRCTPDLAYRGDPYIAMATGNRVPGDQPDQKLLTSDVRFKKQLQAVENDRKICNPY